MVRLSGLYQSDLKGSRISFSRWHQVPPPNFFLKVSKKKMNGQRHPWPPKPQRETHSPSPRHFRDLCWCFLLFLLLRVLQSGFGSGWTDGVKAWTGTSPPPKIFLPSLLFLSSLDPSSSFPSSLSAQLFFFTFPGYRFAKCFARKKLPTLKEAKCCLCLQNRYYFHCSIYRAFETQLDIQKCKNYFPRHVKKQIFGHRKANLGNRKGYGKESFFLTCFTPPPSFWMLSFFLRTSQPPLLLRDPLFCVLAPSDLFSH